MPRTTTLNPIIPRTAPAGASPEPEPALKVATVYQDPLTRHWTTQLWDRVGQLVGHGGIRHQSWKISDLTDPRVFTDAVRAAAAADVLVMSVRDTGELPISLYVWVDAWVPRRLECTGALVALIGVPPQPDAQSGGAHAYLEMVARRAGLEFLPREHKLPALPLPLSSLPKIRPTASPLIPLPGTTFRPALAPLLHRRLTE